MPYIKHYRREDFDAGETAETTGELNYCITMLVEQYRELHGDSYSTFSQITAAIGDALDEFRRRVVHPYEDQRCLTNGDVYRPLAP